MGQFRTLRLPFALDLGLVTGATVLLTVSWLRGPPAGRVATVLTSVLVIGYVFSVPGYALIAALFTQEDEPWGSIRSSGPGGECIESRTRAILSVSLSPILTGVLAILVDQSPLRVDGSTLLTALAMFVLACVAVAFFRRESRSSEARYHPHIKLPIVTRDALSLGRALFICILVVSALVAGGTLTYTAATWESGERFTELSILTPRGPEGPIANNYNVEGPLLIAVGNQEHRPMDYTVVVRQQRVSVTNNTTTVTEDLVSSRTRFAEMSHGTVRRVRIRPADPNITTPGRLAVLLYRGAPPGNPTAENAYRTAYLRFNESDASLPQ